MDMGKVFFGGLVILYRKNNDYLEFLVVENSKTKNITFVGGAKEDNDNSVIDGINREIYEELGLQPTLIKLRLTKTRHEFIFGGKKEERVGHRGSYQVFLADVTIISNSITHTKELRSIKWLKKNEVLDSLSFPDLKDVFLKATKNLV